MKLSILFLAILGVTMTTALYPEKVHSRTPRALKDDFYEFCALLPLEKIGEIWARYINEDHETQLLVRYLNSEVFETLIVQLAGIPEVRTFLDYLEKAGLDLNKVFKIIRAFIGQFNLGEPSSTSNESDGNNETGGLVSLIAKIKAVLPKKEIQQFYQEKLQTSEDFKTLVNALKADEFGDIVANLEKNEIYADIVKRIKVGIVAFIHMFKPFTWGGEE